MCHFSEILKRVVVNPNKPERGENTLRQKGSRPKQSVWPTSYFFSSFLDPA